MKRWTFCIMTILLFMLSSCSLYSYDDRSKPAVYQSEKADGSLGHGIPLDMPGDVDGSDGNQHIEPVKEIMGLVRIDQLDPNIVLDLKYATSDNFTGRQIYTVGVCALTKATAEKLIKANSEFMKDGYRIKIWDGYRPLYAQQIMWDIVKDPRYVADPKKGSSHSTGCTVDITLVDRDGNEIPMPTAFDDFSVRASRKYAGSSREAKENLEYLTEVMIRNGFKTINSEWWEFRDTDIGRYPELDIRLEEFLT